MYSLSVYLSVCLFAQSQSTHAPFYPYVYLAFLQSSFSFSFSSYFYLFIFPDPPRLFKVLFLLLFFSIFSLNIFLLFMFCFFIFFFLMTPWECGHAKSPKAGKLSCFPVSKNRKENLILFLVVCEVQGLAEGRAARPKMCKAETLELPNFVPCRHSCPRDVFQESVPV